MFQFSLLSWLFPEEHPPLSRCTGDLDSTAMAAGHAGEALSELPEEPCADASDSSLSYWGFRMH